MHRLSSAEAVSGKAVPAVASLAFIALLTALSGCGQKGPLYMPRVTTNPAPPLAEPAAPTKPDRPAAPATEADSKKGDPHAA